MLKICPPAPPAAPPDSGKLEEIGKEELDVTRGSKASRASNRKGETPEDGGDAKSQASQKSGAKSAGVKK